MYKLAFYNTERGAIPYMGGSMHDNVALQWQNALGDFETKIQKLESKRLATNLSITIILLGAAVLVAAVLLLTRNHKW